MTNQKENKRKNYQIVTCTSGGYEPPFTASFRIEIVLSDGAINPTEMVHCEGKYPTMDVAHATANMAARQYIKTVLMESQEVINTASAKRPEQR